jgi:hypothetical protein
VSKAISKYRMSVLQLMAALLLTEGQAIAQSCPELNLSQASCQIDSATNVLYTSYTVSGSAQANGNGTNSGSMRLKLFRGGLTCNTDANRTFGVDNSTILSGPGFQCSGAVPGGQSLTISLLQENNRADSVYTRGVKSLSAIGGQRCVALNNSQSQCDLASPANVQFTDFVVFAAARATGSGTMSGTMQLNMSVEGNNCNSSAGVNFGVDNETYLTGNGFRCQLRVAGGQTKRMNIFAPNASATAVSTLAIVNSAQNGSAVAVPTVVTITADQPDPSMVNQPYTVAVSVTAPDAVPTGVVNINDGSNDFICNATLTNGSGSCLLTSTTAGIKTLRAIYNGNSSFGASVDTEQHLVVEAAARVTSTFITSDQPDPSNVNQAYTVAVSITSSGATPTGTVNISDGTGAGCVATLSNGTGSCQLTSTSAGNKTLTANYAGNASFLASSGTEPHVVGQGLNIGLELLAGFTCPNGRHKAKIIYNASGAQFCDFFDGAGTTWGPSRSQCAGNACANQTRTISVINASFSNPFSIRCFAASGATLERSINLPTTLQSCPPVSNIFGTSALTAQSSGNGVSTLSATISSPTNGVLEATVLQQPANGFVTASMQGNVLQMQFIPQASGLSTSQTVRILIDGGGGASEFSYTFNPAVSNSGKPIIGNLSGSWWNPSRSGEGFFIDVSKVGSRKVLLASWFTYFNGAQQYLVGSADVVPGSNAIDLSMISTNGTGFGNQFFANQVQRIPWGTIRLEFLSCNEMRVTYNGNGQSGVLNQQRLIGLLSEVGCN